MAKHRARKYSAATAAGVLLLGGGVSHAEQPSNQVEELVVTARRVEERQQITPVAVSVMTGAALARNQVTDLYSIQYSAPNLVISQNGAASGDIISLRGQVENNSSITVDQSVGLYVDGVYIARQAASVLDLVDLQRVEVLRGPQGTLFGRNTTGGAVNVIPNQPTDVFEGMLRLSAGNDKTYQVAGVVNVPISGDQAVFRVAYQHNEHGGYGYNLFLHRPEGADRVDYVRPSLKLTGDDGRWTVLLAGDYSQDDGTGPLVHLTAFNPANSSGIPQALVTPYLGAPFFDSYTGVYSSQHQKTWGVSGTATLDLGGVTLKSITAERGVSFNNVQSFDATPLNLFWLRWTERQTQFQQELQLIGNYGQLSWVGGLFYFHEQADEVHFLDEGLINIIDHVSNTSYAAYVQGNYKFNDKLKATAGIRYTVDRKSLLDTTLILGGCALSPSIVDPGSACVGTRRKSFEYPSYTLSLDYQWAQNVFLYVRTSMAHKAGGFNGGPEPTLVAFQPEKLTDYEVGLKADLLDRRLRLNVAAFYGFYENMQRSVTTAIGGVNEILTQSVGKAEIPGVEFEISAVPIRGLNLSAVVGLLRPKYTQFVDATGDRSHEPFTNVSKLTGSLAATYSYPVSYGNYEVHVDYGYQSAKYFFPAPVDRQPAFDIVNAKASLFLSHPNVELAIWGKNLANTKYYQSLIDFTAGTGTVSGYPGAPRTYGVSATYRFGG